jgi:hypothetical protein
VDGFNGGRGGGSSNGYCLRQSLRKCALPFPDPPNPNTTRRFRSRLCEHPRSSTSSQRASHRARTRIRLPTRVRTAPRGRLRHRVVRLTQWGGV